MGKKFRGKRRGGGGGGGRGGGGAGPRTATWKHYAEVEKENEKLERYYNTLLQLPEEEKAEFWAAVRRTLPNSFRFCGSKGHAIAVQKLLRERYIPQIVKIEHQDGQLVEAPQPVPWYPNDLAWWMTTPKSVIRKYPPFAAFQKFLVSETTIGNVSRQEVVSMIPPLLMDVRPSHVVLDMCAAPGSKAAQLLEMIHIGEEARVRKVLRSYAQEDGLELGVETKEELEVDLEADSSDHGRATGLLVANDADYKRGHMLVHQLKRLSSPNLIVTNHDATMFPSIRLPKKPDSKKEQWLKFDRILADVPCSGDGTLRKNANLWKDWSPGSALGLHKTQIRILVRALQLLKPGGRVVYSTCSMNPVENEAIIGGAIERCGGSSIVDIIDCNDQLPNLKRYPGMKDWSIMDKNARIWSSYEEVEKWAKEENSGLVPAQVVPSMFRQPEGSDAYDLPLDRCMRVYSHMQDTGGFFITVLEKKKEFRVKSENEAKATDTPTNAGTPKPDVSATVEQTKIEDAKTEDVETNEVKAEDVKAEDIKIEETKDVVMNDASTGSKRALEADDEEQPTKKAKTEEAVPAPAPASATSAPVPKVDNAIKPRRNGPMEEAFKFLDPTHSVIENIQSFYRISPRFPSDRYLVRNEVGEPAKGIYYTTSLARDILVENEGRGIKFIHSGVRMYTKQEAPSADVCRWRIQSEGMPILQGYVGESRIVRLTNKDTLHKLLIEMFPQISGERYKVFGEIGERVKNIGMGCCVLRVEPDGSDPDFNERISLPLWKSIHSLNLMLPKEDRAAMLLRLFNDTSPLINISLQKNNAQKAEKEKEDSAAAEAAAIEDAPSEVDAEEENPEEVAE